MKDKFVESVVKKTCRRCKEEKPTTEYYYSENTGKYRTQCKSCMREVINAKRFNERPVYSRGQLKEAMLYAYDVGACQHLVINRDNIDDWIKKLNKILWR